MGKRGGLLTLCFVRHGGKGADRSEVSYGGKGADRSEVSLERDGLKVGWGENKGRRDQVG